MCSFDSVLRTPGQCPHEQFVAFISGQRYFLGEFVVVAEHVFNRWRGSLKHNMVMVLFILQS